MKITKKLLIELQNRLKVGSRRGVHLNAVPGRSRYKFDLSRLSHINENLPNTFINSLLTEQPLKFKISWKDNVPDLNSLFEEDQVQLVRITKSFENLINQTEAIESEKGINTFGFGFPLLVRRDQSDQKLTVAPVLIWSLRIKRTKEFNTWIIHRDEDDPIYINEVLINHLQNDSKIEIEQLSSDFLDDGLIDKEELLDICVKIIDTINSTSSNDLRDTFRKKLDSIKSISDKKHYETLPLTSNNSFIEFSGLFSIFEVQKQSIIRDYGNLLDLEGAEIDLEDMDGHSFQPISSVDTDPSQQGILHSLATKRNILIQGPPGTGKSQSLTAILVNALENHKKTIVVCEKRTALEVLHNSLNERGLNYQCVIIRDIVKDRKTAVDSVRERVDNSSYRRYRYSHSKETLDIIIQKSKTLIDSINKKHKKLGKKLIGNKNWTHIVGSLLSELRNNSEKNDLDLAKNIFNYDTAEFHELVELIGKGQKLYTEYKPSIPLSFLNPKKVTGDNPYLIEQQIDQHFLAYKGELESVSNDKTKYESELYKIRNTQLSQQLNAIRRIQKNIDNILTKHVYNKDFFDERKTNTFLYKAISFISKEKKTTLRDQQEINSQFAKFSSIVSRFTDFDAIKLPDSIKDKGRFVSKFNSIIDKTIETFPNKIQKEFRNLNLLQSLKEEFQTTTALRIKESLENLKTKICTDAWSLKALNFETHESLINSIKEIIQAKERYFENENDLFLAEFRWFQFYNSLSVENRAIIEQLKEKENWVKVFLIFYFNLMLLNTANIDLPTNDSEHMELDKSLSGLGEEQLRYIREYWFSKQIDATREFDVRNPNLSVENLYNKRKSNNYQRLSLRQIVKFDLDLFTTFFPIILTTPDVCSNLFRGKNQYFDIVMFDEASQLKLEDNLPALLKAKQIIIAGDEHQMPPSNYFSKIFDGTIDDEDDFEDEDEIKIDRDNILLSCESLLDFASELSFEKKYLDFHYRSRHPFLIDFSNYAFYGQRLKPLPNGFEYTPIKYIQVNGTYSDHSNEVEAETVLSILANNINRLPNGEYPSVGIATFNIHQRNLILGKINDRRKFDRYADFNEKMLELEENGLFVKNLENIQGDERDVIILTTTYGINRDGKFAQRFGSINHQKGYKLLNVIITRAKHKIYVCSSIPEEVFLNYKEYLSVEGSNNRRAVFFAYLAYCKSVSDNDTEQRLAILNTLSENTIKSSKLDILNEDLESPFEEEVYQALTEHFDEAKIIPQLQFAGFRIDLVYDSKVNGVPKIAIECDGAAYHSSQEAYLHDRHRQKILEGHGFVFHRIWSTNWWRNPKRETRSLVEFIQNIEMSIPSILEDKSNTSLAFTDNIEIIGIERNKVAPNLQNDLGETMIAMREKETEQAERFKDIVKSTSKVKVRYLNNGQDLKVQLVDVEVHNFEKINGIQKINVQSPLALALMGKSVGETTKVGDLDRYVEILEITNR